MTKNFNNLTAKATWIHFMVSIMKLKMFGLQEVSTTFSARVEVPLNIDMSVMTLQVEREEFNMNTAKRTWHRYILWHQMMNFYVTVQLSLSNRNFTYITINLFENLWFRF